MKYKLKWYRTQMRTTPIHHSKQAINLCVSSPLTVKAILPSLLHDQCFHWTKTLVVCVNLQEVLLLIHIVLGVKSSIQWGNSIVSNCHSYFLLAMIEYSDKSNLTEKHFVSQLQGDRAHHGRQYTASKRQRHSERSRGWKITEFLL